MSGGSILVIGGGLAGTLVVDRLCAQGVSPELIVWCDDGPEEERASNVPGALLHALPGRSLKPPEGTMEAYKEAKAWAAGMQERYPSGVTQSSILRPSWGDKIGRRYVSTYARGIEHYPEALEHQLLTQAQAHEVEPLLRRGVEAAVAYGPSFCLSLPGVLEGERQRLRELGIRSLSKRVSALIKQEGGWQMEVDGDAHDEEYEHVVLCPGVSLMTWFSGAPCRLNAGELAWCKGLGDLNRAISGGGHICQDAKGNWIFGATYHRMETQKDRMVFSNRSREQASQEIVTLLSRLVPKLEALNLDQVQIWKGVRMVYGPDRQPVAGEHPLYQGLHLLGALGSKGCLWAPLLSKQIALALIEKTPDAISAVASTQRLAPQEWASDFVRET